MLRVKREFPWQHKTTKQHDFYRNLMLQINRTHTDRGKDEKYNVAEIINNDQIDNSTCATEWKFRKQSKPCRTMGNRRAQHIFSAN